MLYPKRHDTMNVYIYDEEPRLEINIPKEGDIEKGLIQYLERLKGGNWIFKEQDYFYVGNSARMFFCCTTQPPLNGYIKIRCDTVRLRAIQHRIDKHKEEQGEDQDIQTYLFKQIVEEK